MFVLITYFKKFKNMLKIIFCVNICINLSHGYLTLDFIARTSRAMSRIKIILLLKL